LTPEHQVLDPDFLLAHQPLTLYRLARAKYANLSGIGAALAPGRWNRAGQEAIYTSTEIGVPLLEMLAHTSKDSIPSNLALMKLQISGTWINSGIDFFDRRTLGSLYHFQSLAEARAAFRTPMFAKGMDPFAVAIPSVIVPVWNVVLYPRGISFWKHVSLESVEPFQFDPRLFPENALIEAVEETRN
jgi:RES domain-containing protein